jgi:hypothetical protein
MKNAAAEFANDLFGKYDRLVCSRKGEDEGRAGWGKQPVIDNLETMIAAVEIEAKALAFNQMIDAMMRSEVGGEIQAILDLAKAEEITLHPDELARLMARK